MKKKEDYFVNGYYKLQIRFSFCDRDHNDLKMGMKTIKSAKRSPTRQELKEVLKELYKTEENKVGTKKNIDIESIEVTKVMLLHV